MAPLKNYKLPDGTTRQYRAGEQPAGAIEVGVRKPAKQTPEARAAEAPAKRATRTQAKRRTTRARKTEETE